MNTAQQKSFMMAAECLSFTAAAEKLYISQPVLSRNIAALESELDVLLFVRNNNVLTLTPGGEILYKWMKESQRTLADAVQRARWANRQPAGTLRLGFVSTEVPSARETKTLRDFQKNYPETQMTVIHGAARELISRLVDHSVDIVWMLASDLTRDSRFEQAVSGYCRQCVAVSCAHPLAEYEEVSLVDLSDDLFLSVRGEHSPVITEQISQLCGAAGFVPRIREMANPLEQLAQVEANGGVAIVTENHISRTDPLVKVIPLKEEITLRSICLWDRMNTNPAIEAYRCLWEKNK